MSSDYYGTSAAYARKEQGYREKALKLFPWVCGRCSREFVYSNLRELTVHHVDHDHTNNPEDGSNWELLCLFCHDHEHEKYTEHEQQMGSVVKAGEDDHEPATFNPFADLKAMMDKKNK
ncbi:MULTISPECIES: YajD family HNH nuclease [Photobacterium]|nr:MULTISPECIES: YajD family HNH nuclease [Photobacterium]